MVSFLKVLPLPSQKLFIIIYAEFQDLYYHTTLYNAGWGSRCGLDKILTERNLDFVTAESKKTRHEVWP